MDLLIGLYSPSPRSGKSEVGNYLRAYYGFDIESFALPIKSALSSILYEQGLGITERLAILNGTRKNEPLEVFSGKNGRFLQELVGETFREKVDPGVWVHLLEQRVRPRYCDDASPDLVVDDLRRPNEATYLRSMGATLVKIVRPGAPLDTASKEGLLEGWRFDHTIVNDGTLDDLYRKADELLVKIREEGPRA